MQIYFKPTRGNQSAKLLDINNLTVTIKIYGQNGEIFDDRCVVTRDDMLTNSDLTEADYDGICNAYITNDLISLSFFSLKYPK